MVLLRIVEMTLDKIHGDVVCEKGALSAMQGTSLAQQIALLGLACEGFHEETHSIKYIHSCRIRT